MISRRRPASSVLVLAIALACWLPEAHGGGRHRRHARAGHAPRARSALPAQSRRQSSTDQLRRDHGASSQPTPEDQLREELDQIWGGRVLRRGVTAILVVDAATGEPIYAVHPDAKINPASNVKLLTTATVMDLLGPTFQFRTRIFGPAPDAGGVAHGSVYLRGNGDPTLGEKSLAQLAQAVGRGGVRRIDGDVVLSDDLLRDTVSSPVVRVHVRAGAHPGDTPEVTVTPKIPYIQLHVGATTTSHRHARLSVTTSVVEPGDEAIPAAADTAEPAAAVAPSGPRLLVEVTGTIRRGKSQSYRRSVKLRSTFTGYELRAALRAAGIDVAGRVRLANFDDYTREAQAAGYLPIELASHHSLTLADLITRTNKRSLNWLADRLLMAAGAQVAGGPPSMSEGLQAMYRWLAGAGVNTKEILVDTGSGLSHRTQLTTRTIVRVLRTATGYADKLSNHSLLDPKVFLHSLSVGGVDGTLRHRFRDAFMRGQVIGKTGTLESSVALSGFVRGEGDDVLCFSIVTNGNRWRARGRVRREHEQMVAAMRHYLEARAAHRAEVAAAARAREAVKTAAAEREASAAPATGATASHAASPSSPAGQAAPQPAALVPAAAAPAASPQRPDSAPAQP